MFNLHMLGIKLALSQNHNHIYIKKLCFTLKVELLI